MSRQLGRTLLGLRAHPMLIAAAYEGLIAELSCEMSNCVCPKGRGYFEKRNGGKFHEWSPSVDHYPIPKRKGGPLSIDNVRLTHQRCNQIEGSKMSAKKTAERNARQGWLGRPLTDAEELAIVGAYPGRGYRRTAAKFGVSFPTIKRVIKKHGVTPQRPGVPAGTKPKSPEKGPCQRWNINRGKPCVCGLHGD